MKTKISLMLLSLGLVSASAYAGAAAEPLPVSNDINVTLPDQAGMWSFGATAVLMQPSNKAFNYADVSTETPNGNQFQFETDPKMVNDSYYWWFGADITYAFPGNGRDVTVAYEGLHGTSTDDTSVPGPVGNNNPSLNSGNFGENVFYLTAKGEAKTNYDAGDLLFGQKVDMGTRIRLHPFMGVRYAHINTQDIGTYGGGANSGSLFPPPQSDPFPTSTYSTENAELENTFNGVGPRFGSDAQVNLGQGFSIRGRLGLSALIGSRTVDNSGIVTFYDVSNNALGSISGKRDSDSQTQVIPEIDGRLGLNYTYTFASNMALGFEAGWQATNYFNVISEQYDSEVGHYADNTNFGIQGPYARIQFDVA